METVHTIGHDVGWGSRWWLGRVGRTGGFWGGNTKDDTAWTGVLLDRLNGFCRL